VFFLLRLNGFKGVWCFLPVRKPVHSLKVHSGTLVKCMDRRVSKKFIARAMRAQGLPADLVLRVKSSYEAASAGNKIHLNDPIIAQALMLGIGSGHPGKTVSVFGHSAKCGGMHYQHELHRLIHEIKLAVKKGKHSRARVLRERLKKLRASDPIFNWVARDLKEFNVMLNVLRKRFSSEKDFISFLNSERFRHLLEEFNVMVQLKKLIQRPDFKRFARSALKDGRGKIELIGGIYIPSEKKDSKGFSYSATGRVDFSFPVMYEVLGEENVKRILQDFGLTHERGNPVIGYKLK
jgi:hypothetical protein